MDTKNLTSIITKFIIEFSFNYHFTNYQYKTMFGEEKIVSCPKFLTEVKWTCPFDHMLSKWESAYDVAKAYGVVSKFWAELDTANRTALIEWFVKNYDIEL